MRLKTSKISLSSIDYLVLAKELDRELRGAWVDNVYHNPDYSYYIISFRAQGVVKKLLVIPGEAIFLTDYDYPVPRTPNSKTTGFRRLVYNLRVEGVEQHDFDRIIILKLIKNNLSLKLIIECLKRGILTLTSSDLKILYASQALETSTRKIMEGSQYVFPPSNVVDPRINIAEISKILEGYQGEKVSRLIVGRMGLGSKMMREICHRGGMDPDSKVGDGLLTIIDLACSLIREAEENPKPRIYHENGSPLEISSIELASLSEMESKEFKNLWEALDEYYAMIGFEAPGEKEDRTTLELERMLKVRNDLASRVEALRRKARLMMDNLGEVQPLIDAIRGGREPRSEEIKVLKLDYGKRTVRVMFKGEEFLLDLKSSPASNASRMFEDAKKIEKHMEEVDGKIESLKKRKSVVKAKIFPKKRVEKKWYEKFRWTTSVNGSLILVGKDAGTNELLIKRYVNDKSMVFHADFVGAPFVTIHNVEEPDQEEAEEAALMAACYTTRAWENKYASLDVYWVRGNQVSKHAPSGQYLTKGAFMISGKKNFIRNVELKLWIGVSEGDEIVYGDFRKVRKKCGRCAYVVPGDEDNDKVASRLVEFFFKDGGLHGMALATMREKIRSILPGRRCEVKLVSKNELRRLS